MFDLQPRMGATSQLISSPLTQLGIYTLFNAARAMAASCGRPLDHHPMDPYSPCMSDSFPILLVDDEPAIADVIRQAAKRDFPEAQFAHVSHPDDVLPYLNEHANSVPRLILLDVDLGCSQTGVDLVAQLREHPLGHLVPIVMLSANYQRDVILGSYQQGANAFTHKPYSYGEWKSYVQTLRAFWFKEVISPL